MHNSDVLVVSNLHRQCFFFETTIWRLLNAGFTKIVLQDTGGGAQLSGVSADLKKHVTYLPVGRCSYDAGMALLHAHITSRDDYETVLLIDNDCFLSGTEHIEKLIERCWNYDLDFCSYYVDEKDYVKSYEVGCGDPPLYVPHRQEFFLDANPPGFCPMPHWENALTLFSKRAWKDVSVDNYRHSRQMIKILCQPPYLYAAHKPEYRITYTHFGPAWFHVGNLMKYYYIVAERRIKDLDPTSKIDLPRIGYFVAQENAYGPIYHQKEKRRLDTVVEYMGGRQVVLDAWNALIKDTCMENWSVVGDQNVSQ